MSQPAARLRVLVAEDSYVTRLGTVTLISSQPDMEIVGEAADGPEAVTLFRSLAPDLVVMDLRMPRLDGVHATAAIMQSDPRARVLVLSHYDSEEDVARALRVGARGYLTKAARGEDLLEAIRTVHRGERYLPGPLAARIADRLMERPLSAREHQVLERLHRGLSNREIAEELSISEKTAGMHVSSILEKLGAKNRTGAVAVAIERGLLQGR